jgi:anaerobic magnesium-protoporphyrin IX monomethyl ester cyclase
MLINAIHPYAEIERRYPPLGLGYLVSSLRRHFGNKALACKVVNKNVKSELSIFQPHIVGITSVTQNYSIAKHYARIAKARKIPVLTGGIHISMLPQSLSDDMDVGILGEGERTIIEIFERFLERGKLMKEELARIKGIIYRNDQNQIQATETREPIDPLDQIPLPARDLFPIERHTYLFSSRGCPFRCAFCASSRFWNTVRFFSAEYVVEEIKELIARHGVRLISFYDDLMMADKRRLHKLVSLLKEEKIEKKVKFAVNARANLLTEEVVWLLKEMNVVSVGMGLESGNERILRYLKGDRISIEENRRAIQFLKKYRIAANASFVIGSPDETREEILDTYRFIGTSGLNFVDTYVLTPYPGTPIWEYAKEKGLVQEDMDWGRLNVNYASNLNPVILSGTIRKKEMDQLFSKFQKQRVSIAIRNLMGHPFLGDICRLSLRRIVDKLRAVKEHTMNRTGLKEEEHETIFEQE